MLTSKFLGKGLLHLQVEIKQEAVSLENTEIGMPVPFLGPNCH